MEAVLIEFKDVGRRKLTWTEKIEGIFHESLERAVTEKEALISREVGFTFDEENNHGIIHVGLRPVGTFKKVLTLVKV